MTRTIRLLALCTALSPVPALAQDMLSAELELGLSTNLDSSVNFKRVEGSFMTHFSGRTNLQLDFGMSKYEADGSTSPFMALHVFYAVTPSTDIGMFLSGEDRLGTSYTLWGAEFAHTAGALEIQGYAGFQDPVSAGGLNGNIYGLDLAYALGTSQTWSLLFGAHMADLDGGANRDTAYLGVSRKFANGMTLEARAAQHDTGDAVLSVSAHFQLGDGVRFNRRDFYQNFPDY